jgi:DNA-directed RNA polymerase
MEVIQDQAAALDKNNPKEPPFVWKMPYYGCRIKQFYFKTIKRFILKERLFEKAPLKSRRAAAPNFVHNLDATHLIMTLSVFFNNKKKSTHCRQYMIELAVTWNNVFYLVDIFKDNFIRLDFENDIINDLIKENRNVSKRKKNYS